MSANERFTKLADLARRSGATNEEAVKMAFKAVNDDQHDRDAAPRIRQHAIDELVKKGYEPKVAEEMVDKAYPIRTMKTQEQVASETEAKYSAARRAVENSHDPHNKGPAAVDATQALTGAMREERLQRLISDAMNRGWSYDRAEKWARDQMTMLDLIANKASQKR